MFTTDVYVERRNKLRKSIQSGLILMPGHSEAPVNYAGNTYRFRQNSNFIYFFGLQIPGLAGVIDIEEGTDCLYGDEQEIEDIIWSGTLPSISELAANTGVSSVHPYRELKSKILSAIRRGRKIHFLPPYRGESKIQLSNLTGIRIDELSNYASKSLIKAVVELRSVKYPCEIEEIETACATGYKMHCEAMRLCKPEVREHRITGVLEGIAAAAGGMPSFPIIQSQDSQILHNHSHDNILKSGKLMITDAGAETAMGYASDFTRTIPVNGKFTAKQADIYNIVLAANNHSIEMAKPNVFYYDVHIAAAKIIAQGLKDLGLMRGDVEDAVQNGAHALFFPHGLGHMMGLDVHDMEDLGENYVGYDDEIRRSGQFGTAYLRLGRRLRKGFVLTVEPGIYFIPALIDKWESEQINTSFINFAKVREYIDFGGIRLEDNILITENACRLLGKKRIPITIDEVEAEMSRQ
jgi:Xaa-Pro aminopeptidase